MRKDDLTLEKAVEVKEWSMPVNSTLLRMCATDGYLLYRDGFGPSSMQSSHDFFYSLTERLIDNTYDVVALRQPLAPRNVDESVLPSSSAVTHLSPLKARRGALAGRVQKARIQRKCRVFGVKCTY